MNKPAVSGHIQIGRVFTSACLLSPSLGEVHPRYPFKDPRPAFNCCSTPTVNTEQPGSQRWELWRSLRNRDLRYIEIHCGNQTYGRPSKSNKEFVFWVGKKMKPLDFLSSPHFETHQYWDNRPTHFKREPLNACAFPDGLIAHARNLGMDIWWHLHTFALKQHPVDCTHLGTSLEIYIEMILNV